jgi:protein ImuB
VRNVADLARLPRDGFARRFGPELLDELDEAFGRRAQPRRRLVIPERFDERLELPSECASSAALWPACEHLLGRLQAFLRARAAGLRGLSVELGHRGLPSTRLALGLARPSADVEHLSLLLGERLDRTPLPAAVVTLRLRSSVVAPVELREPGLFARLGCDGDPQAAARLLERLRARLGHDAVFSVGLVAEHRPEAAWRIAEPVLPDAALTFPRRGQSRACAAAGFRPGGAALCAASPTAAAAAARGAVAESAVPTRALHHARAGEVASGPPERASFSSRASEVGARPDPARARGTVREARGDSPHFRRANCDIRGRRPEMGTVPRPLWMLAAPQPLRERDGVPLYERAPLSLVAGPERIESGWWDGGDVRRDYYVAHAPRGLRLWVYRARESGGGWWLHGVFG